MKKLIILLVMVMGTTALPAQDSHWFARLGVGTRAMGDSFQGMSFGLEVGKSIGWWAYVEFEE